MNVIKKAYRKFIPFSVRVKIGEIRFRKEIKFQKTYFKRQEAYFRCHIDDFMVDVARKNDILRVFSLLRKSGYYVFPEMDVVVRRKYFTRKLKIEKDLNIGLFYVLVDNKKLFYKAGMNKPSVYYFFNTVSLEQDYDSPHRYLTNDNYFVGVMETGIEQVEETSFGVSNGGVVIDAGAAEGNFALSVVERASKVYIVESNAKWCEAMRQTFLPYKDKVEIIQKCLSNVSDDNNITLIDLIKEYNICEVDFLKMDIEGYEKQALFCSVIDDKFVNINKMAICVYHNPEDEVEISKFVSRYGYKSYVTKGYMFIQDFKNPPIRKAVLRAYR